MQNPKTFKSEKMIPDNIIFDVWGNMNCTVKFTIFFEENAQLLKEKVEKAREDIQQRREQESKKNKERKEHKEYKEYKEHKEYKEYKE